MKKLLLFFAVCAQALFAQQTHMEWSQETKKVSACEYDLIFKVKIAKDWHIYSIIPSTGIEAPSPTTFTFNKSPDIEYIGKVTETPPHKFFDSVFKVVVRTHEHQAVFTQRVKVLKAGPIKVTGKYDSQVCHDELGCEFPPIEKFEFKVEGSGECATAAPAAGTTETEASSSDCHCDTAAILAGAKKAMPQPDTAKAGSQAEVTSATTGHEGSDDCHPLSKFFLGLFAGLGAVLMPCIYSLIPLTVSFFIKRSKNRASGIKNSLLYGFFIIITFVIPTMLITVVFGPDALSNIATNTWLNLFFFLLFVVFALSFFGMFEITLPSSWGNKLDQRADKGGIGGIFFMAATLVVVSFSCTAGFLGPLLTALAEGSSYLCPLVGFTGFGTGIALPFMIFAFFPSMLSSLPKSGGWMNTFKVSVAFIELALAVKFLANADNVNTWGFITREVFITLWIAIFGMMTLYLLGLFKTSHDDDSKHLSTGRILLATITLAFTVYLIPGLWGAPLKIISSFPPPHHYAESPNGVGHHSTAAPAPAAAGSGSSEQAALESRRVVGPDGIMLFKDDYDNALKYAQLVNKPLFVDFTGLACVNCRLMESTVWVTPEVLPILRDSVVIVSLYVDSKVMLPAAEQKEVFWYGKQRTLETIGDKWAYYQSTTYKSSSQPQYVLLQHDGSNASAGTMGTETNQKVFAAWLQSGLSNFRTKR